MDRGVDIARTVMTRRRGRRWQVGALLVVPVVFLGYFFVYPLISIAVRGLTLDGSFDPSIVVDVLSDASLQRVALFTVWQATLSTILTLAVGLPLAWVFARFSFRGKRVLSALTLVPFVLPTLVVATAFVNLLGPRGMLGIDLTGTLAIILIAHVFYNVAIVVRGVGSFWSSIDPRLEDAARTLGATRWRAFRTVTLPVLMPAIIATATLVFLFAFTSFGVVLVLGDLTHTTIEVEIYRQATAFLRLDVATTLAVLQIVGIGVVLAVYAGLERRSGSAFTQRFREAPRPATRAERISVRGVLTVGLAVLGAPLVFLVFRSLQNPAGGFGVQNYRNLFGLPEQSAAFIDPTEAVVNSLLFAVAAMVVAMAIGLLVAAAVSLASRRAGRVLDTFVMLPLGTSAVTIGFGFLIALDWPVDLRGTAVLIPIAHALVGIPFVVRTSSPALGGIQPELGDAAATLGASPWQVFRTIELPIIRPALLVAAAFAFAISMGEFGATSFITRPASPTIPIAIFRYLGQPGSVPFGAAIALSVLLMGVTAIAVGSIDRFGTRRAGTQG
jgi:thiamine transport system permease protein